MRLAARRCTGATCVFVALTLCSRTRGDFGMNLFHNSNPQHGGSYPRFERRMHDAEFEDFLSSVKGWDHDKDTQCIWRSFYFDTYDDAYLMMGRLYAFCYASDKYPNITWDNKRIDIYLYSPTFKGLSKKEARVAAFMNDQMNMLRKSKHQQSKLLELASETIVEQLVGDEVKATLEERAHSAAKPLPETVRGTLNTLWDNPPSSADKKLEFKTTKATGE